MMIHHSKNIIETRDEIRIVPITNPLDSLDTVRDLIKRVVKDDSYQGKVLSVAGYFLNDDKKKVVISKGSIKNVVCPYRNLSRKI